MLNTWLARTDIILQTQSEFRPQHDECKRGVVVHVIRVVHSVLLTWGAKEKANIKSCSKGDHYSASSCGKSEVLRLNETKQEKLELVF